MNHTSSLRFSLRYATPRQDAVAGEIHPSPLHYAEAGKRDEKIIFKKSCVLQGAILKVYKKRVQVFNRIIL